MEARTIAAEDLARVSSEVSALKASAASAAEKLAKAETDRDVSLFTWRMSAMRVPKNIHDVH